jgi:hypothetical protein
VVEAFAVVGMHPADEAFGAYGLEKIGQIPAAPRIPLQHQRSVSPTQGKNSCA